MIILQLIQKKQLRGAEIFASQLSEQLIQQGHVVIIVSLFEGTAELPFSGAHYCLNASQGKRFFDFNSWRKLSELINELHPEIVQANASDTLKYAVFSRFFFRWRPKIVFRNASLMSAFIKSLIHRFFNQWLLNRCDYFISVSERSRRDLVHLYPDAGDRSRTIPIGTYSFDHVKPVPRKEPRDEPVFINMASFVPEKNLGFLITVFDQYLKKNAKGYLWLVGDGILNASLKRIAAELEIEDRVKFWGYQKDVISILKAADVFMMPSHIEGLPGAILEALSCGVPVIASNAGGIAEIIENDVNGFCLSELTPDEYIHCMELLTEDNVLRERFTRAGNKIIQEDYLMPQIAKRFYQCYLHIAAPGRKS